MTVKTWGLPNARQGVPLTDMGDCGEKGLEMAKSSVLCYGRSELSVSDVELTDGNTTCECRGQGQARGLT